MNKAPEQSKQIKENIENLKYHLSNAWKHAGALIINALTNDNKELKIEHYKHEIIDDTRKIFELLYDKANDILDDIESDYIYAIKEPVKQEPEEEDEIPW